MNDIIEHITKAYHAIIDITLAEMEANGANPADIAQWSHDYHAVAEMAHNMAKMLTDVQRQNLMECLQVAVSSPRGRRYHMKSLTPLALELGRMRARRAKRPTELSTTQQ